jgi:hypothetical protein
VEIQFVLNKGYQLSRWDLSLPGSIDMQILSFDLWFRGAIALVALMALSACSKEPQDSTTINLMVDNKLAFNETAEGSGQAELLSKYKTLIGFARSTCGNREGLEELRNFLKTGYAMQNSAEITIQTKAVHKGSHSDSFRFSTNELKVALQANSLSCENTSLGG